MKDTEFAKSVLEEKTEEWLVGLLKDKKGITVSVEDIKDIIETVKQIPTEELDVSAGGIDWKGIGSGLAEGAKNAFGQGEEEDDLLNTLKFGKGVVPGLGAYGTYIAGAAALATLTYANYEGIKYAYDKIKGK